MSEPEVTPADDRGVGDNSASVPLVEQISAELANERSRADELLTQAAAARFDSAADAGKAADLILMLRVLERTLEKKRDTRKQPSLLDIRAIETAFAALLVPLARARAGPGSLTEKFQAWGRDNPDEVALASIAGLGMRRKSGFRIYNLKATVDWLVEHYPDAMLQAARSIIGPILRHAGIDNAQSLEIPGVLVEIETQLQVRS